ncbi:KH domain-containing protein [Candidatus Gracilibacteria bacterium]|nr:KH domain-containing protein [Candidatus Gracilibacteria bacterium]
MSESSAALEFARYVLEQICDHKSDIQADQKDDELGTLISVQINEEDMGRLIGKNGKTVSALRLLVRAMGAREGKKINLKVLEPVAK